MPLEMQQKRARGHSDFSECFQKIFHTLQSDLRYNTGHQEGNLKHGFHPGRRSPNREKGFVVPEHLRN